MMLTVTLHDMKKRHLQYSNLNYYSKEMVWSVLVIFIAVIDIIFTTYENLWIV